MLTAEYNQDGIHVFIFCCADYEHLLSDCIQSIEDNVQDTILSKNIVSNTNINVPGWTLIKDEYFWRLIDPTFEYKNLYGHNWIKQQIFKLNLDLIKQGNLLVIDAEVRFNKPIRWIDNNLTKLFYCPKKVTVNYLDKIFDSSEFVESILNIKSDPRGFITEAMIFNSEKLQEIKQTPERIRELVFEDPQSMDPLLRLFMSEYDLYSNYMISNYSDAVELIELTNEYYSFVNPITSNSLSNQTKWLTFYQQIKDDSWPECNSEEEFSTLPLEIQTECIEVHGYKPKDNNETR